MAQDVVIQPVAVPNRGIGRPDYSRISVGSEGVPVEQQSGVLGVNSISGQTVFTAPVSEFFTPADNVNSFRQNTTSGGRLRYENFIFGFDGSAWDRVRTISGVTDGTGVLAVALVSGYNVLQAGLPAVSGGGIRYVPGVVSGGGAFVVASPASGKALLVHGLQDSYLGVSGNINVGWQFGSGALLLQHMLTPNLPNADFNLENRLLAGPRRTVSGASDLQIVAIPVSVSGVAFTAWVEEI